MAARPARTPDRSPPERRRARTGTSAQIVAQNSAQWFQAWLDKDPATLRRLMAADYLYVGPNGLTLDGPAILRIVRSRSYRLDHGRRTEIVVRALGGEVVLVRDRYRGAGSHAGTAFTDDQRCVMIWAKDGGEWRLVMEHCTPSGTDARTPRRAPAAREPSKRRTPRKTARSPRR